MNSNKSVNFLIGVFSHFKEETDKLAQFIQNEYNKILTIGINNNSDEAIAIRETTDFVISFIEEIKSGEFSKKII